ncbi:unnamed protein product [Acanthoscelides obtectus]|uniref:Uncharacterized protein n=1 Tax=Acanthoscelides obtectus TaxID=200917 RepID=A0A9P0P496_ACAOB|nr:unnamed protein product [Acanthoscelides obtectus]CAK1662314.1 hypothetical protein AOBTE_LOCUS23077 [Acanthoscelides obtectus]
MKTPDIKTFMKFVEFIGKLLRKNRFPKRHVGGITEVLVSKRRSRRHKSSFTELRRSPRKRQPPKETFNNGKIVVHSPKEYKYWTGRYPEEHDKRTIRHTSRRRNIYKLFKEMLFK